MDRFQPQGIRAVERIDDAAEADERVVDHLARLGCDPSQPRATRHFLYFAVSRHAENVASVLFADGWSTAIEATDGVWLLVAGHVAALTPALVRDTRSRLEALASEYGGFYDGWEAPV